MITQALADTLPLQGSEIAARWDSLYNFLIWLSVFFFILVVGGMIYFIGAYKFKPGVKSKYITGNHLLEAIWIAVPTLLLLVIFGWGYSIYHAMTQSPTDAYEVRVIGKQWLWTFQYDDGRTLVNEVYVPTNRPVKFIMTSEDVLHSFFIPNFRIKQDVVPGMYTSVWFTATVPGKHQVYCAEYCGTSHSGMLAKVIALNDEQWDAWLQKKKPGEIPDAGSELTQEPNAPTETSSISGETERAVAHPRQPAAVLSGLALKGKATFDRACASCHTVDGSKSIGPSMKGLFGSDVTLKDGTRMKATAEFIGNHIKNPQGTPIAGYDSVMPIFQGVLEEVQINEVVAYIKSLKTESTESAEAAESKEKQER